MESDPNFQMVSDPIVKCPRRSDNRRQGRSVRFPVNSCFLSRIKLYQPSTVPNAGVVAIRKSPARAPSSRPRRR